MRTPRHSHLGPLACQDLLLHLSSLRQGSAVCLLLHSQRVERGGQEALPAFVALLLLLEAVAVLPELQPGQPLRLFFRCGGDSLTLANTSLRLVGDLREHLQRLSLPPRPAFGVHGARGVLGGVRQLWHDHEVSAVAQLVLDLLQVPGAVLGHLGKHLRLGGEVAVFMDHSFLCTLSAVQWSREHISAHLVLAVVGDVLPATVAECSCSLLSGGVSC